MLGLTLLLQVAFCLVKPVACYFFFASWISQQVSLIINFIYLFIFIYMQKVHANPGRQGIYCGFNARRLAASGGRLGPVS